MPQQELIIQGRSIQSVYNDFVSNNFFVNRQYQRKLVWGLKQKQSLIDSIYRGYPIPLILLTHVRQGDRMVYEIIDGLQRLDAIISFIQGEFSLDMGEEFKPDEREQYFDLRSLVDTMECLQKGELIQNGPIISADICKRLANYEIPFSIYGAENASRLRIDDVFKRINSSSVRLTKQEIRQAASLHPFAQLVRRISSQIRGDTWASDILPLDKMKMISITSKGNSQLEYGILLEDIPWRKQRILPKPKYIRGSQDEELVARLLAYMLLKRESNPAPGALDEYYQADSESGQKIIEAIQQIGKASLEHQFLAVYEAVQKLSDSVATDFAQWMFNDSEPVLTHRYYDVVFLAIYELCIRRNSDIVDDKNLAESISGLGSKQEFRVLLQKKNSWRQEDRQKAIEILISMLNEKDHLFAERSSKSIPINAGYTIINNIFDQSKLEPALFDMMVSYYPLESNLLQRNTEGREQTRKISKALTAIANQGPGNVGYVVIGATQSKADAEKYKSLHRSNPIRTKGFSITGIEDQAVESYQMIHDAIRMENIRPLSVKEQIERDITLYSYKNKSLLVYRVESPQNQPCSYDDTIYTRVENQEDGSIETVKASPSELGKIYAQFA